MQHYFLGVNIENRRTYHSKWTTNPQPKLPFMLHKKTLFVPDTSILSSDQDINYGNYVYASFPVDVVVYFHMQPSTFRFSCLPVSRVECMLQLPSLDIVFSSKRAEDELFSRYVPMATQVADCCHFDVNCVQLLPDVSYWQCRRLNNVSHWRLNGVSCWRFIDVNLDKNGTIFCN